MDSPEFLMKKAKRELEFLSVYSKIGENLERSIRNITSKLKDWLADTNRILDVESFVKIEQRYVHYKEKLTRLVSEVEERKLSGKKSGKKRIKRIERVSTYSLKTAFLTRILEYFEIPDTKRFA
jgi:hypothetical protein